MGAKVQKPAPLQLRAGQQVELIRWSFVDGEWDYELVRGEYRGRARDGIQVEVGGTVSVYDRDEWQVCDA